MKKQIEGQMSIYDYIQKDQNIALGFIKDSEAIRLKGKVIPFADLVNYIGKKVLLESPKQGHTYYKVILGKFFEEDEQSVWNQDKEGRSIMVGKSSRFGYAFDEKRPEKLAYADEMYSSTGRYEGGRFASKIYELA